MLPKILIAAGVLVGSFFRDNPQVVKNIQQKTGGVAWDAESAPACPDPLILQTPVDLTLATAILYPGQERGGDFKPHGGFRFDNSKNTTNMCRSSSTSWRS